MKKTEAEQQLPLLEEMEQLLEESITLMQEMMMELEKSDPSQK